MNERRANEQETVGLAPSMIIGDIAQPEDPVLGRYKIVSLCGRGGMASVYYAQDLETSGVAAVKMMPIYEGWDRIEREVSALRRIHHPNVVRFIDFGMHQRSAAIVMEYLHGVTFGQLLEGRGYLPWRLALRMGLEALEGLKQLHSLGLIHRDIKPSNIMVLDAENVKLKLLDLGVVKPVQGGRRITQTGLVLGTPFYMAPEQCAGLQVTPAADIFSLGVVLWQAITGCVPHRGILFVPHWSSPIQDIPSRVRELIEGMVSTSLISRFQGVEECSLAINQVLEEQPSPSVHAPAEAEPVTRFGQHSHD